MIQRMLRFLAALIGVLFLALSVQFALAAPGAAGRKDGMLLSLTPGNAAVTMRELL
jgi:hypothetical protein